MSDDLCTSRSDCVPPDSKDNEITECNNDGTCTCTEPYYGTLCNKNLTETHRLEFALIMYPLVAIHLFLTAVAVRNMIHHKRKGGKVHQFSFSITYLMIGCNLLSTGFYATGYNFNGDLYIPFVPWALYYLFEGGSASMWAVSVTVVISFWLDVFTQHHSRRMLGGDASEKLKHTVPLAFFTAGHLVVLVLLMVQFISYHTWIVVFVVFEVVLVVCLLFASRKIFFVIRQLHGSGETVAVTTICLAVVLFFYIVYDLFYVTHSSDIAGSGAALYLTAEAFAGYWWAMNCAFIVDIGFKGLEEPYKLMMVQGAIALMHRCLSRGFVVGYRQSGMDPPSGERSSALRQGNSIFDTRVSWRGIRTSARKLFAGRSSTSKSSHGDETDRLPNKIEQDGALGAPTTALAEHATDATGATALSKPREETHV